MTWFCLASIAIAECSGGGHRYPFLSIRSDGSPFGGLIGYLWITYSTPSFTHVPLPPLSPPSISALLQPPPHPFPFPFPPQLGVNPHAPNQIGKDVRTVHMLRIPRLHKKKTTQITNIRLNSTGVRVFLQGWTGIALGYYLIFYSYFSRYISGLSTRA